METDALELNGVQKRAAAIELGPGIGERVVTVDASIVAVEELAIRVECGGVVIGVRSCATGARADIGPGDSAIGRSEDAIRRRRGAGYVNYGRAGGIDDESRVIPALASHVVGSSSSK